MIYENGVDTGYRDDLNWWSNPQHPDAFRFAQLNQDYPPEYFKTDHVSREVVARYCTYVSYYFKLLTGEKLESVIEFGSAGGWFAEYFRKEMNLHIQAVEGSASGIMKCMERGLTNVAHQDLRVPAWRFKDKVYGIALCTEVAEHAEMPFHAILVSNIIQSSNLIWWSAAELGSRPHLHHPAEMPHRYWVNLFEFYGYGCYMLPDHVFNDCEGRGRCIFYNKKIYKL